MSHIVLKYNLRAEVLVHSHGIKNTNNMINTLRFKALAFVLIAMSVIACQKDANVAGGNSCEEMLCTIEVLAPELNITRLDGDTQSGKNSAYGAIDYADDKFWAENDVRYTFEVYDASESYSNAKLVKARMVNILPEYGSTRFELRLIPDRKYLFVVFADFVKEGSSANDDQATIGKHHTLGDTLADIRVKEDGINDESCDAYFLAKEYVVGPNFLQKMTLTRPYAKLRLIASDLTEMNSNRHPKAIRVTYEKATPKSFSALNGKIAAYGTENESFVSQFVDNIKDNVDKHYYNEGYDALTENGKHTHLTLFTDYILAIGEEQTPIHFKVDIYEDEAMTQLIKTTEFDTEIPIQRNHLTTVIGNVHTTGSDIVIDINDNFENPKYVVSMWDGISVEEPEIDAEGNLSISNGEQLAWFANDVNSGTDYRHKSVRLTKDINLGGAMWTPIGESSKLAFDGDFDGAGHTISNFAVSTESGAGLFGYVGFGSIKNVTVKGATIETHHYGGALAGYVQNPGTSNSAERITEISNCHAKSVVVTVTPDANLDNGDKAGGLIGYTVRANVSGCRVSNAKITAYRDCGGLIGHANSDTTVSNCSVSNSDVVADQSVEYCEAGKEANADAIVGRKHSNLDLSTSAATGVSVTVIPAE